VRGARAATVAVVADDDGVTRRILSVLLERQGCEVHVAVDGDAALTLVRERRPEILFLDARMPGLDGFEVCRAVRDELPSDVQPFVFMITAAGEAADRERASSVGIDEFLTKPFSPSQLSNLLGQLAAPRRT